MLHVNEERAASAAAAAVAAAQEARTGFCCSWFPITNPRLQFVPLSRLLPLPHSQPPALPLSLSRDSQANMSRSGSEAPDYGESSSRGVEGRQSGIGTVLGWETAIQLSRWRETDPTHSVFDSDSLSPSQATDGSSCLCLVCNKRSQGRMREHVTSIKGQSSLSHFLSLHLVCTSLLLASLICSRS